MKPAVRVNGPGLPTGTAATSGAHYVYDDPGSPGDPGSHMVRRIQYKLNGALKPEQVREYDSDRDLLTSMVFAWDPAGGGGTGGWEATPSVHRKFVWFNWLMLLELDGSDDSIIRRYTWGLDLSGQHGAINSLEQAGSIGGLLAIQDEKFAAGTTNLLACYDGNGNLTQHSLEIAVAGVGRADAESSVQENSKDLVDAEVAIEADDVVALERMLAAGLSPNTMLNAWTTLLTHAASQRAAKCAQKLIECGADVNAVEGGGGATPLSEAVAVPDNARIVGLLLSAGAEPNFQLRSGETILNQACAGGDARNVGALLKAASGIDPSMPNKNGERPLETAAAWGHKRVLRVLLDAGADVDAPHVRDGTTALHTACGMGYTGCARILLARGADPNRVCRLGRNALMYAVRSGKRSLIELLKRHNVNLEHRDVLGKSAREIAVDNGDLVLAQLLRT